MSEQEPPLKKACWNLISVLMYEDVPAREACERLELNRLECEVTEIKIDGRTPEMRNAMTTWRYQPAHTVGGIEVPEAWVVMAECELVVNGE